MYLIQPPDLLKYLNYIILKDFVFFIESILLFILILKFQHTLPYVPLIFTIRLNKILDKRSFLF